MALKLICCLVFVVIMSLLLGIAIGLSPIRRFSLKYWAISLPLNVAIAVVARLIFIR